MPSRSLVGHTFRSHLGSALAIGIGGGAGLWIFGLGYAQESARFVGGREALGQSMQVAAEAMRVLRWPAERLDTLGGYMTYHNLTLLPLLVGLYAIVQGAQAIRGAEERGVLEMWLASGRSRASIVVARTVGFLAALCVAALGLGTGTALALAAGGESAPGAALLAVAVGVLAAFVFYAAALLVSQVFRTSGRAVGLTSLVMVILYVANNVSDQIGVFGALRFASPFFYRQSSDVLVPGHAFDTGATLVLAIAAAALVVGAIVLLDRRDYGAPLWRSPERAGSAGVGMLRSPWLRTIALASLGEQRGAIFAWIVGTGVFLGTFALLIPAAVDLWDSMPLLRQLLAGPSGSLEDRYVSFAIAIIAPATAAFAVVQCSHWVADEAAGRTEMLLSCPVSRGRLLTHRAVVVGVGALLTVAGGFAGLAIGSRIVDVALLGPGLARGALMLTLVALAVAGVGSLVTTIAPRGPVVGLLVAWIVASSMLVEIVPLLAWPAWIARLSIFDALGEPYLVSLELGRVMLLAALAFGGPVLARFAAQR